LQQGAHRQPNQSITVGKEHFESIRVDDVSDGRDGISSHRFAKSNHEIAAKRAGPCWLMTQPVLSSSAFFLSCIDPID
jgi:hypothetical protein